MLLFHKPYSDYKLTIQILSFQIYQIICGIRWRQIEKTLFCISNEFSPQSNTEFHGVIFF
ncbi:hypothetical protein BACCELL_01809 [Bacteroides cellulosilyticus DSM 14838]|uniref:Uncharacterized protein n=1 Tax=Bacteroides cellulosilyticus DSM 14838 TaxID=537012 RepID=E2NC02_9BACE|nr:hypothetical protein BACCELL_01809 [Bacteroides cellulosilyticus DSM 14838]